MLANPVQLTFKARALQRIARGIPGDLWRHVQHGHLFTVASSLAYTTLLSIIPALAVSFAIFHAYGGASHFYNLVEPFILNHLAEDTSADVILKLHEFIDNAHANVIGIGGLVGLVFTTVSMLSSIETAINRVWHTQTKRPIWIRITAYFLIVTLGPLALAVAIGMVTSHDLPLTLLLPSSVGLFFIAIGFFFFIYKYVPSCAVRTRYAFSAAVGTAVLFNLARQGYALYAKRAMSYNQIYGSLSAIPILLLWIYIVWVIILLGAALSSVLQKRFEVAKRLSAS